MRRNNIGFTLIELLAVIVILAIIAVISIPIIMNVTDEAKKGTFKNSAYGIINAAELYYSKAKLLNDKNIKTTFIFPEDNDLEFKGSKPKGGALLINNKGEIALAIHNGEYCIKKWYTDEDINVSKGIENCTLDFVPPTITLSNEGPIFVLLNEEFIIPEATAYDDVSLDVTTSIQIDSNVDNTKIGHYEITYTVSDAAGNKASKTIKVFVGNKYEYTTPSSTAYTLVVPYTGTYRIEVSGAQGGRGGDRFGSGGSQYFKAADGEKGSKQEGIFYLNEGDTISILVGGIGRDGEVKNNTSQYYRTQNGGNGGGSSVKINNVVAIQAAGGEGSLGHNPCGTTCNNSSDVKASNGINGTITTNVNTGDNPIYTAKSQLGNGLVKITIID